MNAAVFSEESPVVEGRDRTRAADRPHHGGHDNDAADLIYVLFPCNLGSVRWVTMVMIVMAISLMFVIAAMSVKLC